MEKYFKYFDKDFDYRYSFDKWPRKELFTMHAHSFCELYIFLYGKGIYKVEGNEYPLSSGDIIITRPSETHYIDIDESVPYERLTINFRKSYFDSIENRKKLLSPFYDRDFGKLNRYPHSCFKPEVHRYFVQNLQKNSKDKHIQLVCNLLPLLGEIQGIFNSDNLIPNTDTFGYKITNFINENINEDLSLDTICAKFHISKSYLCKIFKSATGSTVQNYIRAKRLINAKNLLKSGMPPSKVAYYSGYTDYSSFFKAFYKQFGISPQKIHNKK